MTNVPLDRFLRFLDEQTAAAFQNGAVENYLLTHPIDPDDLLSFVFFRDDTFGRNLVHRTPYCELAILTWLPGNKTQIHDHGGSRCWIAMHTGALKFQTYAPIADEGTLPPMMEDRIRKEGDLLYIDDAMGIHRITNDTTKPAISMHLYAGPMPKCRVYDERMKRFIWKELSYFTQYGRQARTHVLDLG